MKKSPLLRTSLEVVHSEQGSVVPYVFGWFLGIPTSVLFLIFVLRGCH